MDLTRARRPMLASRRVAYAAFAILLLVFGAPAQGQFGQLSAKPGKPADSPPSKDQAVSLNQLADIIENDATRERLVAELRRAAARSTDTKTADAGSEKLADAGAEKTPGETATADRDRSQERVSFARLFARWTAHGSELIGSYLSGIWDRITYLYETQGTRTPFDLSALIAASVTFALVAVSTIGAFIVLRLLAMKLFSAIGRLAPRTQRGWTTFVRRTLAIVLGIAVDATVVLLAVGCGYITGLYAFGDTGAMGTRESLFINAFAIVELIKVALRALFAPRYDKLRPLNIPADLAGWWNTRLRVFVSIIGYGLLVAVPIVNTQVSFFAGAVLTFLLMGGIYVYALKIIFGNRKIFTLRLLRLARHTSVGFFAVLYRLLARLWLLLALTYFTVLFVVSQAYPDEALPFMLSATVQTVLAAALGFGLSGLLSQAIGRRLRFSERLRKRLPMLEARVNSYVPNALKAIRVVILLVAAAVVANAWHLFDFDAWLSSDAGLEVIGTAVKVAIVLVSAALLWLISASIIEHRLNPNTKRGAPSARQQTLLVLFRNALAILIATFTAMITLSQIGVNIGPLIAGAGVLGLAIGFGAQKLVQDIITGVFIQLENAMNAGDTVSVGGVTGTAERLTIRSVSIRDIDGTYHIVPFSAADVVSNYMRDFSYFRTEYGIAYREDIDNAVYYLREAFADLRADPAQGKNILENMNVAGVTALADSAVNIRIMIKTKPGTQFGLGRAFNRLVKIHFDRAGIEIPFPHQTLYFGEDRKGHAPPANLRVIDADVEGEAPRRLRRRRRGDDAAPEETGDAPGDV